MRNSFLISFLALSVAYAIPAAAADKNVLVTNTPGVVVTNTPQQAVPVTPAQPLTHMGRSPQDHVLLKANPPDTGDCVSNQKELRRILPDGTEETTAFQTPAGRMLVVTDVDWEVFDTPTFFSTDRILSIRLGTQNVIFYRISVTVTPDLVTGGTAGGNDRSFSGVVFGPGTTPCISAISFNGTGGGSNSVTSTSLVRGYLIYE